MLYKAKTTKLEQQSKHIDNEVESVGWKNLANSAVPDFKESIFLECHSQWV